MKYDKLWKYIKNKDVRKITFKEIEEILIFKINHAFLNRISKISLKEKIVYVRRLDNEKSN